MRWEDLPFDAHIIFVSHEWVGWSHPDPHGIQLTTFLQVMTRLLSGEIDRVSMSVFHRLLYKENITTTHEEWKEILETAYIWFDWSSMPQPSACISSMSKEKKEKMGFELGNAVKSIPAYVVNSIHHKKHHRTNTSQLEQPTNRYVERADFVAVVVPGCLHADRRDSGTLVRSKTCYRTYRRRGWCVLEMFSSQLSRRKTHPTLLITSGLGVPNWISPLEAHKLAVGASDFTCCERNHIFGENVVPCDRGITHDILKKLIKHKAQHLFEHGDNIRGRLYACFETWWLRTKETCEDNSSKSLSVFMRRLHWNDQDDWFDHAGISILFYAVIHNDTKSVQTILSRDDVGADQINAHILENGFVEFGIPRRVSILICAMSFSNVSIVKMLLQSGANPKIQDKIGFDCLMYVLCLFVCVCVSFLLLSFSLPLSSLSSRPFTHTHTHTHNRYASTLGRTENIKYWLSKYKNWDINRGSSINGSTALHCAVFFGRKKLKTVRALVEIGGASLDVLNHGGASVLSNAVDSVDSNIDVVRYLISKRPLKFDVNYRRRAVTPYWKLIYGIARGIVKTKILKNEMMTELSHESGTTALHCASRRGDVALIELLIQKGADPLIRDDLGLNMFAYCDAFPEIIDATKRVQREAKRVQNKQRTRSLFSRLKSRFSST
ncbi:ankyrin repeat domain-containing protein [bacterium]|nr:ankyrin repeat domain-containing protein [bacterium]